MRNDTGHQLYKFDRNLITNSKMADKMAAEQGCGCISSVYISFQVLWNIAFLCWAFLFKYQEWIIEATMFLTSSFLPRDVVIQECKMASIKPSDSSERKEETA